MGRAYIGVRVDEEVKQRLETDASEQGISLSSLIESLLIEKTQGGSDENTIAAVRTKRVVRDSADSADDLTTRLDALIRLRDDLRSEQQKMQHDKPDSMFQTKALADWRASIDLLRDQLVMCERKIQQVRHDVLGENPDIAAAAAESAPIQPQKTETDWCW